MLKILEESDGTIKSIEYSGQKISLGDILDFREATQFYNRFQLVDIIIEDHSALNLSVRVYSLRGRMVNLRPDNPEILTSFRVVAPDKAVEKLNDLYQLICKLDTTIQNELEVF